MPTRHEDSTSGSPPLAPRGREGRPPLLDAELQKKITQLIMAGHYLETAAAFNGIGRSTLMKWLKRGRDEINRLEDDKTKRAKPRAVELPYMEFVDAVEKALGISEVRDLTVIDKAAQGGVELGQETTTTRETPVLDDNGNPVLDGEGRPLMRRETTTSRQSSKAAPVWQAAAWRLERRRPDLFGRRTVAVELSGPDGAPLPPATATPVVIYLPDNGRDRPGAETPDDPPTSDDPVETEEVA